MQTILLLNYSLRWTEEKQSDKAKENKVGAGTEEMQCRNPGHQVLLVLQTSGLGALSCQGAGRAALRPTGT